MRAPDFDLPRLSGGGRTSLEELRGKVVVLNIWASWCDPCRAGSPLLERWHRRISAGGRATVLGVDVLDVSSDARAFVREYRLSYPQLRDSENVFDKSRRPEMTVSWRPAPPASSPMLPHRLRSRAARGIQDPALSDSSLGYQTRSEDSVRSDYGAGGVPETVVIDARGRIAAIRRGPVDEAFMRDQVLPLVTARQ